MERLLTPAYRSLKALLALMVRLLTRGHRSLKAWRVEGIHRGSSPWHPLGWWFPEL